MTTYRRCFYALATTALLLPSGISLAEDSFTSNFDRGRCTFTTTGSNPYFPLWPGYSLRLEGEQEDDGETVEVATEITVLHDTQLVDGILTRVVEEREWEDEELVEVSRNFMAFCRETGDVWYFGEDVDDYEDDEVVGHGGSWRAGVNGSTPGILMLGTPVLGARYQTESAPGVAEDRGEVVGFGERVEVPAGTFDRTLSVEDTNALDPDEADEKIYAYGVGLIVDEDLELVEITRPPCQPDATTHCLNGGRFRVTLTRDGAGPGGTPQPARASLASDESGAFWFFSPNNAELLVKVLDGCTVPGFQTQWVFAAGVTNVGVTLTVEDTRTGATRVYRNAAGSVFAPILDTAAFSTCP